MFFRSISTALIVFVLLPGFAMAQDEPLELITDRPDQTESANTIAKGHVQLEVGALFSHVDDGDFDIVEVPGTLVRIGLDEKWELRIGWTGWVSLDQGGEGIIDESGIGDAELGFKVRLSDEKGAQPEMAILVSGSVPIGDDEFTSDEVDPAIRLSLAHTLSDRMALGYNLGVGWESGPGPGGETTTLSSYLYTVALGVTLSDTVGLFLELFGDIPASAPGTPATSFDGGFTFLLRDNVQLDVAGGFGLSDAADDWFAGVGISVLF